MYFVCDSVSEYVTVCETGYECDVYDCVLCNYVCDCTCNCVLCMIVCLSVCACAYCVRVMRERRSVSVHVITCVMCVPCEPVCE